MYLEDTNADKAGSAPAARSRCIWPAEVDEVLRVLDHKLSRTSAAGE